MDKRVYPLPPVNDPAEPLIDIVRHSDNEFERDRAYRSLEYMVRSITAQNRARFPQLTDAEAHDAIIDAMLVSIRSHDPKRGRFGGLYTVAVRARLHSARDYRLCQSRGVLRTISLNTPRGSSSSHVTCHAVSLDQLIGDGIDYEGIDDSREEAIVFLSAIRTRFSDKEWRILCGRIEGFQYGEIANSLGIKWKAIDNAFGRIRTKIQDLLALADGRNMSNKPTKKLRSQLIEQIIAVCDEYDRRSLEGLSMSDLDNTHQRVVDTDDDIADLIIGTEKQPEDTPTDTIIISRKCNPLTLTYTAAALKNLAPQSFTNAIVTCKLSDDSFRELVRILKPTGIITVRSGDTEIISPISELAQRVKLAPKPQRSRGKSRKQKGKRILMVT